MLYLFIMPNKEAVVISAQLYCVMNSPTKALTADGSPLRKW